MQFGLDTKHWEIPFVYFVTIVIHLVGGENYMVLWCHVIHDYCIAKYKRFFIDLINVRHLWWTRWSSQIVSITLGTFVCCGKWTLLLGFTMCLNWVHVFIFIFSISMCLLWNLFYLHFHFQFNRTSEYMELDCPSSDVEDICKYTFLS